MGFGTGRECGRVKDLEGTIAHLGRKVELLSSQPLSFVGSADDVPVVNGGVHSSGDKGVGVNGETQSPTELELNTWAPIGIARLIYSVGSAIKAWLGAVLIGMAVTVGKLGILAFARMAGTTWKLPIVDVLPTVGGVGAFIIGVN